MEYRILGRTCLRVSAVSLGCEGFMHGACRLPLRLLNQRRIAMSHGIDGKCDRMKNSANQYL